MEVCKLHAGSTRKYSVVNRLSSQPAQRKSNRRSARCLGVCLALLVWLGTYDDPTAWTAELPPGFSQVSGRHIDVITDMPLSDDLRELTRVFDAAVPGWCAAFALDEAKVADWHVEAFVMLERQRFIDAGFLPEPISHFANGFQYGDRLWVMEQASAYYLRHLLLHEGTHWVMTRKYGKMGPPWLMEGMAEWLGTHRWDGQKLTMGIIPQTREEVPYWGRIKLIQQELTDGVAPSLETILRYSDSAHLQQEAYAWSWAAIIFLKNHPDTSATFAKLLGQPMQGRDDANRWLFGQLKNKWPQLRLEWNATLTELEYGYDPSRSQLALSRTLRPLQSPQRIEVDAARSWQATGISVQAGTKVNIVAEGEFVVGGEPKPWPCFPDGVTLEYYRGQPLGKLQLAIVQPIAKEPDFSLPINAISVGAGGEFTMPQSGELQFRINETSGGLADNSGTISITVSP